MATREMLVKIIGDSKSLERAFGRSTSSAKQFEKETTGIVGRVDGSFKKLNSLKTGAGFLGGTAAVAGLVAINKSVEAASDLNEQVTKSQQIFGQSSADILAWSKTTAKSMGIAQAAALEATGSFGQLFETAGLDQQTAAEFSKTLTGLASDIASFNNIDPGDALEKLRSGLAGEAEPLRAVGVLLSEARVKNEAYRSGIAESGATLTEAQKVQARYNLILQDTASAQGDFARTSDGLANTQRRLNAQLADTTAQLGKTVAPIKNQLIHFLIAAGDATNQFAGALKDLEAIPAIHKVVTFDIIPGGGGQGKTTGGLNPSDLFKANIFDIGKLGLDAIRGTGPFGKKDTVNENQLAKAFDKKFDTFTEGLEKGKKSAAQKIKKATDGVASFGQEGFKPLEKSLSQIATDKFDKVFSGLELNLDRAGLTDSLNNDLAVLNQMASSLRGQIKAGNNVGENEQKLVQVLLKIKSAREQVSANAQSAADAKTSANLERLAKQKEEERAKLERIAKAQADAAKALQSSQFRALGLDEVGNKPPPAIANLKKQLAQLSSRADLTSNNKGILGRIRNVLIDPIHKATPETRDAIKGLFDTIRGTFDEENTKGLHTKAVAVNRNQILAGLGLDRDTERLIARRLGGINSLGNKLAKPGNAGAFGRTVRQDQTPINVHVTTTLDGEPIARSTTKIQQKNRRSNPRQKRGPNAGV